MQPLQCRCAVLPYPSQGEGSDLFTTQTGPFVCDLFSSHGRPLCACVCVRVRVRVRVCVCVCVRVPPCSQYKMVELLAEGGADLSLKNRYHETPMTYAEIKEDGTMIRILKALINKRRSSAVTADTDGVQKRPRSTTKGASVKRKSMAEKQKTATLNMKQEREEAALYAKMMLGKGGGSSEAPGTVIYSQGDGNDAGSGSKGKQDPKAEIYSQPVKKVADSPSAATPALATKESKGGGGCCVIL